MASQVLQDPRRYLLAIMAGALTVIVPMIFLFITMMDRVFGSEFSLGWTVLWLLLGAVIVGLVTGLMVLLARATRQSDLDHEAHINHEAN